MIEFDNVRMRYRKNMEDVLKGITFTVHPGAKIGIVGRTGAGKSSIMQALFRMVPLSRGKISIDGVPINAIGLHVLRHQMSIIPQSPTLFNGSLRYNLDPLDQCSDKQL